MYYQDIAIILSRRDFRQDDLLVSVYTQNYGKLLLQSKGAKKIKSKLAGHLEPTNLAEINWVAGRGDKMIGASLVKNFSGIKSSCRKVAYTFYFLEIFDKIIQLKHSDRKLFNLLFNTLEKTNRLADEKLTLLRIIFVYKFLALSGHNPVFKKKTSSHDFELLKKIIYSPVDQILNYNIKTSDARVLFENSQVFLEEILEQKLLSEGFLLKFNS